MAETPATASAALRKRAEKVLAQQEQRLQELSATDIKKLIHELGTHQVELEIQNEELRQARAEAESSRRKYADLYNFSPVGYLTIGKDGLIKEINATGAAMLGAERAFLTGKPFSLFIEKDDLDRFDAHRKDTFGGLVRQTCELRVKPRSAPAFSASVQSVILDNDEKSMQAALVDISDLKRAEAEREKIILALQEALAKIKTLSGLVPICAWCNKIRDKEGHWQPLDVYIMEHTDATFSHGMCPECHTAEQFLEK